VPCSLRLFMTCLKRKKLSNDEYIHMRIYWRRLKTFVHKNRDIVFLRNVLSQISAKIIFIIGRNFFQATAFNNMEFGQEVQMTKLR